METLKTVVLPASATGGEDADGAAALTDIECGQSLSDPAPLRGEPRMFLSFERGAARCACGKHSPAGASLNGERWAQAAAAGADGAAVQPRPVARGRFEGG